MTSTDEMQIPSDSQFAPTLSVHPPPPPHPQPTTFTSQRPPPLTTTSPPVTHSTSPSPPSAASSSSISSTSPAPLVLSPSDLSSIITLKHNHDTLTQQHYTLLTTLAQHEAHLTRQLSQHRADEAEWERRMADSREQYERVMRDWSEESEKRHTIEQTEQQHKQQIEAAIDEQRRRERTTRLVEADLSNERRLTELLREKVQQLDRQLTHLTITTTAASTTQSTAEADEADEADVSLLAVHRAVLSRRVQRLELELTTANEQLAQQQVVNAQQLASLNDINAHLTALSQQPTVAAGSEGEAERESEVVVMAEVECVVLRERLKCERRNGWRRERKLYCLVLVWLVALLAVSVGGMLYI